MSLRDCSCTLSCVFAVQEAARNALLAPGPGPLSKGVAPKHNLSGILPIILSNDHGMQVHVLPVGATLQRVIVPNQQGVAEDIVLGFDDPTQYQVRVWHSSLTVLALLHLTKQPTGIKGPAHPRLTPIAVKLNCT